MRKLLFILLLVPVIASLGHDAYIYYQEPEKGIRLSDLGALWDKYHKESHDQWKTKVQEFGENVDNFTLEDVIPKDMSLEDVIPTDIIPEEYIPEMLKSDKEETNIPSGSDTPALTKEEKQITVEEVKEEKEQVPTNDFSEGFTQSIARDGTTQIAPLGPEDDTDNIGRKTRKLISLIGFLLEQKAVFVLGAIPLFFFFLNMIFSSLFKEKEEMDKIHALKKKKQRKGGGYQYSRK